MKLLLDEMISRRVAAELRNRRQSDREHDDTDPTVLAAAAGEQRAVVTNNVRDYLVAHGRLRARGGDHYGVVFTYDDTLPRNKAAFPLWVSALEEFLGARPGDEALLNRIYHLLP